MLLVDLIALRGSGEKKRIPPSTIYLYACVYRGLRMAIWGA